MLVLCRDYAVNETTFFLSTQPASMKRILIHENQAQCHHSRHPPLFNSFYAGHISNQFSIHGAFLLIFQNNVLAYALSIWFDSFQYYNGFFSMPVALNRAQKGVNNHENCDIFRGSLISPLAISR